MSEKSDVLVIGGGVIGVACAYYLSKAGFGVRLVEKGKIGAGCSHGNGGLISPSHALPLAMPGAIGQALKWMFKPDAPVYLKLRPDIGYLAWLIQFARRCNRRDMLESLRGRCDLLLSARALYDDLIREESFDCGWQPVGSLTVCRTRQEMAAHQRINELLTPYGLGAIPYTGRAILQKEPALRDDVAGGWFYAMDAHLRPDLLMREWHRAIVRRGARVDEDCEVLDFESERDELSAVLTRGGATMARHHARWFVLAAAEFLIDAGSRAPEEPWYGWRPMTVDGMPIINRSTRYANLIIAAGHNMQGLSLATVTGKAVLSLVCRNGHPV